MNDSNGKSTEVSVIIPTFNRQDLLGETMRSVLDQDSGSIQFEIVIVDNNSADDTKAFVRSVAKEASGRIRYLLEPKQGVSHARNLGIASAQAPILAFLDDDVRADPGWIVRIKQAFDNSPDIGFIGGKVIARHMVSAPAWLTREHWAPLALLDYGDQPISLVSPHGIGLITANCAIRKSVFEKAGLFKSELQRAGDKIGSMEDHELFERFLLSGVKGLYLPDLIVSADIPPVRMTKAYHRRWHFQHGGFYAIHRSEQIESTNRGRLLGVPAHLYRQAAVDAYRYVKHSLLNMSDRAFGHEIKLRFFAGFFSRRVRDHRLH